MQFPLFSHYCIFLPDNETAMENDIMTIKEVADYLKLNEKTAYRLTSEGKIPGFKVGGSWRFHKQDIDQWIEEKKRESKDK